MARTRTWLHRQSGTIAVATAVSMFVLVGFLGVVVDLGRMYVIKTELQNAADACALAAAKELDITNDSLTRAEKAGIAVGTRHWVNFQSASVTISPAEIKFSPNFTTAYRTVASGAKPDARYVMCSVTLPPVGMTLSSIIGLGPQTIRAQAVATRSLGQTSCTVPLAMCRPATPPTDCEPDAYGFCRACWYKARFDTGVDTEDLDCRFSEKPLPVPGPATPTARFSWIDFGGHNIATFLSGPGVCNIAPGKPVGRGAIVGEAAVNAWNSRFGLDESGAPDFTGYAYHPDTWKPDTPITARVDFMITQRQAHTPYQGNAPPGVNAGAPADHAGRGADRRLVLAPIVDCTPYEKGATTAPIEAFACVLMLHPVGSPSDDMRVEYVGLANHPNSPCSSAALAGGSSGPPVPVLVQ